jgi:curved DNA-binding protein CbpA
MKLKSKYFDSIRVKPEEDRRVRPNEKSCQWQGCAHSGTHKAPMGRGREGRYFLFCIDHVREYNRGYNYFDGMNDTQVADFQKDAVTGHRPTWKMGVNSWGQEAEGEHVKRYADRLRTHKNGRVRAGFAGADPHGMFSDDPQAAGAAQRRPARKIERRHLETMGLSETAVKAEIKQKFKELVKKHHPDRNGGDRSSEDKLREIIQAYNYLKQAGLV